MMYCHFETLLTANQIKIPRTPILTSLFERKWAAAENAYLKKMRARYHAKTDFDECYKEQLKEDWGVEIEYPSFETPRFTTPEEALAEISKIPVPTYRDLYYSTINTELTKWVQELIANAPEDSTLIYVRATDYFTPTSDEYIKERMANKLEACTVMSGICIVYIGFKKDRPLEELNLPRWSIVKTRANVEYV